MTAETMPRLTNDDLRVLATNLGYSVQPRERVAAMAAELLTLRRVAKVAQAGLDCLDAMCGAHARELRDALRSEEAIR